MTDRQCDRCGETFWRVGGSNFKRALSRIISGQRLCSSCTDDFADWWADE